MIELDKKPFYLNEKQQKWVKDTLKKMNQHDKVGQLFCETLWNCSAEESDTIFSEIKPGGVMFRPNPAEKIKKFIDIIQERSDIPLLVAANFERGGNGGITEGTYFGTQMQVAATDDDKCAERFGIVAGREAKELGFNWSFAPIVDLDINYFSTVTNTRTYGSDPIKVIRMAKGYMKGIAQSNVISTIKHFPGDGMDFRDQHNVASINTCSVYEWDETYGAVYSSLIDEGAEAVMVAHIKCPAYSKHFDPKLQDKDILPGSLSKEIMQELLRNQLGFNGLIVSDDSHMAGFMNSMKRKEAVPYCVEAGVDMFLFTVSHKEDIEYMKQGLEQGILSEERLNDAVTRILALKAKLNLFEKKSEVEEYSPESFVGCEEHRQWSHECADKAITLVKDIDQLLPLSPKKYKRILLIPLEWERAGRYDNNPQYKKLKLDLEAEGFEVFDINLDNMPGIGKIDIGIEDIKGKYDLMLYFIGAKTGYRIKWKSIVCGEIPSYTKEIPAMAISFNSPYMLMDIPMVSTYINAYSESDYTRKATVEKIMGRSEFKGVSPVDPFCGMWDLSL